MTKSYVLPNRITRLKRQNRMLPTEATFNRVWEQMELLKSKSSIKMFLKKSISNNYKNLDIDLIKNGRNKFNISKGMPERFINVDEVDEAANKVSISIGQAHEYFKAANNASPMTKPLILYYGMVSFAKALISSTYCIHDKNRGHGLFVFDNDEFKVTIGNKNHNMGEYQSFRDCYMGDTSLYTRKNPLKFNLKDLLAVIPGIRMEWMLAYQKEFDERYYDIHQMPPKHHKYFKIKSYIPLKVVLKTSNDDFNVIYDLGDAGEIHKPKYVINLGIHGYDFG